MLQTNANVTTLTGSAGAADWDRPAGIPPEKWAGDTRAYYREKSQRVFGDGTTDVVVTRTVWLPALHVLAGMIDGDDTLTIATDAGDVVEARVKAVAIARPTGDVPADVATCRIDLENG